MHRPRPSLRGLAATAVATPWIAWAVVRTFGLEAGHPLVGAMTITPYAAASAPLPVLAALALRSWIVGAVALVAALALAASVLPRAIDGPQLAQGSQGRPLVVMSANVHLGRADPDAIVRLVREHRVDVLSLQELTPAAVARLDAAGIRRLLPARVLQARAIASGSGLMARRPLRQIGSDDPATHTQPEAESAPTGGQTLRFKVVHPVPPISGRKVAAWRRELRGLPGPSAGRVPRVLVGDFNATLDHREMRRLLGRGFYDAADATGDGFRTTWPIGRSLPKITIDHVLVPRMLRVSKVSVHNLSGSDHRVIIVELVLDATGAT
jgi:endonuclease/exonuclease/phosphatase family metal-dependent hydrolase